MDARKYEFSWDLLGDAKEGRPNLGEMINLKVYRLMQYTFRDVLEKHFGTLAADQLFLEAGKLAGTHFFRRVLAGAADFHALTATLQDAFKGLGVGIFRLEKADPPYEDIVLTVAEDADCSGRPSWSTNTAATTRDLLRVYWKASPESPMKYEKLTAGVPATGSVAFTQRRHTWTRAKK